MQEKGQPLKYCTAIKVLSILALVLRLVRFVYDLRSVSIYTFQQLIGIIPCVLLVVYVFVFYKKRKASIIVSIIFALIACESLLEAILFIIHFNGLFYLFDFYYIACRFVGPFIVFVTLMVAAVFTLKWLKNKALLTAIMTVVALIDFLRYLIFLHYLDPHISFLLENGTYMLARIALYVALNFVVAGNKIPPVGIAWRKRKNDTNKIDPESELRLLNYKLNLEIITKEDYEAQRAEITKRL